MYSTAPKGSKAPNQNVDTQQEIGKDRFVPKAAEGKDGAVRASGSGRLERKPPTKKGVSLSTQKHHANQRPPYAKGGGNDQVSFTAPKSRTKFGTEKSCGKDQFTPKTTSKYGVGGV